MPTQTIKSMPASKANATATLTVPPPVIKPLPDQCGAYQLVLPPQAKIWFERLTPETFQGYQDLEATWNHPLTQFSVSVVKNTEIRDAYAQIHRDPHWGKLAGAELVWLLLIWTLRSWRLRKVTSFFGRLAAQFWIGIVAWAGFLGLVPYLVWGTPFWTLVSNLFRAALKCF